MAVIINKLRLLMEAEVPRVFDAVFEVTLQVRVNVARISCACCVRASVWYHPLGILQLQE